MYLGYQNNKIKFYTEKSLNLELYNLDRVEETNLEYALKNDEYVLKDEAYEEWKQQQERQRLDMMTLTPADVERALYKAKGMDFDDLKELIATGTGIDLKALAIEFRASNFYRGATFGNGRLFDVVGNLLGYTSEDIDYLFLNKELPEKIESEPSEEDVCENADGV